MNRTSIPAHRLTLDQWAGVDRVWASGTELINDLLNAYRSHRSRQGCAHPACAGKEFDSILSGVGEGDLYLLLRVAISLLEIARLEQHLPSVQVPDVGMHELAAVPDREVYYTGTGQKLAVHAKGRCIGEYCVIHRPEPGPWDAEPGWLTHWRVDRRIMERVCPHGIGHPAPEGLRGNDSGVHGCDGCCLRKE